MCVHVRGPHYTTACHVLGSVGGGRIVLSETSLTFCRFVLGTLETNPDVTNFWHPMSSTV